jgi:hypothetical protein
MAEVDEGIEAILDDNTIIAEVGESIEVVIG